MCHGFPSPHQSDAGQSSVRRSPSDARVRLRNHRRATLGISKNQRSRLEALLDCRRTRGQSTARCRGEPAARAPWPASSRRARFRVLSGRRRMVLRRSRIARDGATWGRWVSLLRMEGAYDERFEQDTLRVERDSEWLELLCELSQTLRLVVFDLRRSSELLNLEIKALAAGDIRPSAVLLAVDEDTNIPDEFLAVDGLPVLVGDIRSVTRAARGVGWRSDLGSLDERYRLRPARCPPA